LRIAIIFPTRLQAQHLFKDIGLITRGFLSLGHDTVLVCREKPEIDSSWPVQVLNEQQMIDSLAWARMKIDAAIVYTWMGNFTEVVAALKKAGVYTISKGDTDGNLGVRVHPYQAFIRMIYPHDKAMMRARATGFWLKRYAYLYRREDELIKRNLENADVTIVETKAAKMSLRRFLSYYDMLHLENKIKVVPNPVSEDIIAGVVPSAKRNKIVAIGRWEDPAKDVTLLTQSIARFLADCPETEVVVIGGGGESRFDQLSWQYPSFNYIGMLPHHKIAAHLADAQVCLFTSRWEGSPVAGNEALAMGCTIVGTPIPGIQSICMEGPYGAVAEGRAPRQVAAALKQELFNWACGRRDLKANAGYWRKRLAPSQVAQQILSLKP
jgi:glycosyltransferase involved in cell wall biosynthesis